MILQLLLLLLLPSTAAAAPQPATTQADRSAVHTLFTEQDPRSPVEAQRKNPRIIIEKDAHYDLKDESFELYQPADYDGTKPYGVFVWISAGERAQPPRGFMDVMDQQHLIYISANNSGNERPIAIRFGLALDAVLNLKKTKNIDVSRIYCSGISGGAKIASMLAVIYSDTFTGAVPIVGVAYSKPIPIQSQPGMMWPPVYYAPPPALLERAKVMNRFVFITGPKDMNHDSIAGTFKLGFQADRFQHVDYVEVPGMGHELPPIERLNAAIQTLDAPLPSLMPRLLQFAQQAQRTKHLVEAREMYKAVLLHADPKIAEQARKALGESQ